MSSLVCVNDFEEYAKQNLSKINFEFYSSGAGAERTLKWNKSSYSRYRIRPRFMRKVKNRSISTKILGKDVSMPIGVSPTAFHKVAHPDGECATARAVEKLGSIFILSSHSNTSLEEVAKAAPNCRKWLQLYVYESKKIIEDLVKAAEKSGYEALVFTVDFTVFGIRPVNLRNKFVLPPNLSMPILDKYLKEKDIPNVLQLHNQNADWTFIKEVKEMTNLSIIVKGVLTAEDAILAVQAGADGIIVSNHGGRQLDSVPTTLEALPEIVKALGHQVDVYADGGIRDGTDVFKAIGLGAKMVFIGRPAIWGLVQNGEEGVKKVLSIYKTEFDNALGLAGCNSINEISPEMVVHESYYSKI